MKVSCLGDSFANGPNEWPQILAANHPNWTLNYCGIGGQTLGRLYSDYFPACVLAYSPDYAFIQGGTNNALKGHNLAAAQSSIISFYTDCIAAGIVPVFFEIAPLGGSEDWTEDIQTFIESYNAWLASYCATNSIQCVLIYDALRDGIALAAEYDSGDGVHPNYAGELVIESQIVLSGSSVTTEDGNSIQISYTEFGADWFLENNITDFAEAGLSINTIQFIPSAANDSSSRHRCRGTSTGWSDG